MAAHRGHATLVAHNTFKDHLDNPFLRGVPLDVLAKEPRHALVHFACVGNHAACMWLVTEFRLKQRDLAANNFEALTKSYENHHYRITLWLIARLDLTHRDIAMIDPYILVGIANGIEEHDPALKKEILKGAVAHCPDNGFMLMLRDDFKAKNKLYRKCLPFL